MLPGRAVADLPQSSSSLVTVAYSKLKMNKSEHRTISFHFWQVAPKVIRVFGWEVQGHIALRCHVHDWKLQDNG